MVNRQIKSNYAIVLSIVFNIIWNGFVRIFIHDSEIQIAGLQIFTYYLFCELTKIKS